jgi:hypothetical protein
LRLYNQHSRSTSTWEKRNYETLLEHFSKAISNDSTDVHNISLQPLQPEFDSLFERQWQDVLPSISELPPQEHAIRGTFSGRTTLVVLGKECVIFNPAAVMGSSAHQPTYPGLYDDDKRTCHRRPLPSCPIDSVVTVEGSYLPHPSWNRQADMYPHNKANVNPHFSGMYGFQPQACVWRHAGTQFADHSPCLNGPETIVHFRGDSRGRVAYDTIVHRLKGERV